MTSNLAKAVSLGSVQGIPVLTGTVTAFRMLGLATDPEREPIALTNVSIPSNGDSIAESPLLHTLDYKVPKRPSCYLGRTYVFEIPYYSSKVYLTLNYEIDTNNKRIVREVFIMSQDSHADDLGRSLTIPLTAILRSTENPEYLFDSMRGVRSTAGVFWFQGRLMHSIPHAIATLIEELIDEPEPVVQSVDSSTANVSSKNQSHLLSDLGSITNGELMDSELPNSSLSVSNNSSIGIALTCPSCHRTSVIREEGCYRCRICDYSKCE